MVVEGWRDGGTFSESLRVRGRSRVADDGGKTGTTLGSVPVFLSVSTHVRSPGTLPNASDPLTGTWVPPTIICRLSFVVLSSSR